MPKKKEKLDTYKIVITDKTGTRHSYNVKEQKLIGNKNILRLTLKDETILWVVLKNVFTIEYSEEFTAKLKEVK